MKIISNIGNDVSKLIYKVSILEGISETTRDLVLSKLDSVYLESLEMTEFDTLDLREVTDFIMNNSIISENDKRVFKDIFIKSTTLISEMSPVIKEIDITEAPKEKKIKDKLPVFFIFNGGNNVISKTIMLFTRSDFSHISISLSGLDEIISFATTDQNYGLVVENWFDFRHIRKPVNIGVHFIDVPLEEYEKIKNMIEFHKAHTHEYTYSFKKMFTTPFKTIMDYSKEEGTSFICSEFVYYLIVGTSIADHLPEEYKKDVLITPKEFKDKVLTKSNILYEGKIDNFNPESAHAVYNLYDDNVLAKKKAIDKRLEKKYEKKPEHAKSKLKQLRIKINK